MKNKILSTCVLLTSCALTSVSWANHHDCKPNSNKIVLNVDKYQLELKNNNKKPVCLLNNSTFRIEIKQPGNPDLVVVPSDVDVEIKPNVDMTIERQPPDDNLNYITVKVSVLNPSPQPQEAAYSIKVKGVGELDPRVRVVGGRMLKQIEYEAVDRFLKETFGMSFEDAIARFGSSED